MVHITTIQSRETSLDCICQVIEKRKNWYVLDTMYENFNKAFFDPTFGVVFSNKPLIKFKRKLSKDRWYEVNFDKIFKEKIIIEINEAKKYFEIRIAKDGSTYFLICNNYIIKMDYHIDYEF